MTILRFAYKRLVGDKEVEMITVSGGTAETKSLNSNEIVMQLLKKLKREYEELSEAYVQWNYRTMVGEIADIEDVIASLKKRVFDFNGMTNEGYNSTRLEKFESRWGFDKWDYVEYVDVDAGNPLAILYRESPEQYPEITKKK